MTSIKKKFLKKALMSVAAYGLLAGQVSAAPIFFSDRASFDAAAGALNFESFEDSWVGGSASVSFDGFTLNETGGSNQIHHASDFLSGIGASITDGSDAAFYQDNGASTGNFFSFANPVTAFGLDITANFTTTMGISGSVSDSLALSTNISAFWGVIDLAGLTTLSFDASGGHGSGPNSWDGVGFDSVSYGMASVPEPNTALLFGAGFLMFGMMGRKRK